LILGLQVGGVGAVPVDRGQSDGGWLVHGLMGIGRCGRLGSGIGSLELGCHLFRHETGV
jgi:hypothetical protein